MKPGITIKRIVVGELMTNCYIISSRGNSPAVIIDPGGCADKILEEVSNSAFPVKHIVITHGHIDHIGAAPRLMDSLRPAPRLCIHGEDAPMLKDDELNLAAGIGAQFKPLEPDCMLKEGDAVTFGGLKLEVLHTPGHSPGGICLAGEGFVFTGDTLFASGVGRTDFPGGDFGLLRKSIIEKLFTLDESFKIYPGHGPESTIGEEKTSLVGCI